MVGVLRPVARRAADERAEFPATGVAQHVDEEQAILGRDVAQAEHRRLTGRAVDVRHAVGAVACDRQTRHRRVRALLIAGRDAEARVLEQRAEVVVRHAGRRGQ